MKILQLLPRFQAARKAIQHELDARQRTRDQIEERQIQQINETWQGAWRMTEHYRALKKDLGLPEDFGSLQEFQDSLPILNKGPVRTNRHRFLSETASNGQWQRTGGSTGKPTSVYWSCEAHLNNLRRRYAWLSLFDVDFLDRQAMIWGHAGSFARGWSGVVARYRRPVEDRLRGRLRLSAYQLGERSLDLYLDKIDSFKPKYIYGYSSAIGLLANRAICTQRTFDSLRLVVMTGEPASQDYNQAILQAFNCPGRIEYGSVECGNIAFESPNQRIEIQESARYVETVRRDDGLFDIVVSVLDNPSFPLLRYKIGDITSQPISIPETGFATLTDIQGRNNDYLVAGDGELIHANALKHVIEHERKIDRFQAVQDENGQIEIFIETSSPISQQESADIRQSVDKLMGQPTLRIHPVERIEGNLAGKHRWVVSRLYEQLLNQTT